MKVNEKDPLYYLPGFLEDRYSGEVMLLVRQYRHWAHRRPYVLVLTAARVFDTADALHRFLGSPMGERYRPLPPEADGDPLFVPDEVTVPAGALVRLVTAEVAA